MMKPLEEINEYLTQAKIFFLSTVQEDRPKCRPIAFHLLQNDHLYFGIGDFKEVYRQMQQNPKVELCAVSGQGFLRYYGIAVFEQDDTIANQVLAALPQMQKLYNDQTGYHLAIFHLEQATAEFRNQLQIEKSYAFD